MRKTIKRAAAFAAVLVLVLFAGACNIGYVNETTFINRVTETAVKAGVKIEIGYGIRGGILDTEEVYQGSGVIYAQNESGEYFALTNNHVVEDIPQYGKTALLVFDCYGNLYEGRVEKTSAADDLAVVSFAVSAGYGTMPETLEIAAENAGKNALVAAVGSPDGQFNAVTLGRILRYAPVTLTEETSASRVEYAVVCHTAVIHGGSSGGMLVDKNMRIVGINYAGGSDEETGDFIEGYAVPAEKINAFLRA